MFLCVELADSAGTVFGAGPLGSGALTPGERLGIEILEVTEGAGGEERLAGEADRALDTPFFVAPRNRHGAGLETVVGGELKQCGMKADRLAHPLEHGALKIVIEQDARYRLEKDEGIDMTAQEVVHGGIEVETQKHVA